MHDDPVVFAARISKPSLPGNNGFAGAGVFLKSP